jgi:hypothetical protein
MEWRTTLYSNLLFIDFEKVLDSFNRKFIWNVVLKSGMTWKNSNLIKPPHETYTH